MLIIWRPYTEIEQSINCLSEEMLFKHGILETTVLLSLFYDLMCHKNNELDLYGPFAKFYWNNAVPYIQDLLLYYKLSIIKWQKLGGEPTNPLGKVYDKLQETQFSHNCLEWKENWARNHRYILLYYNWQWYKRHFRQEEEHIHKL